MRQKKERQRDREIATKYEERVGTQKRDSRDTKENLQEDINNKKKWL